MMIAASYRLAFLSNPRLLIGILSRGEKRRLPPPCVCVYTRTCVGACTSFGHFWQAVTLRSRVLAEGRGEFGRELIILAVTCA